MAQPFGAPWYPVAPFQQSPQTHYGDYGDYENAYGHQPYQQIHPVNHDDHQDYHGQGYYGQGDEDRGWNGHEGGGGEYRDPGDYAHGCYYIDYDRYMNRNSDGDSDIHPYPTPPDTPLPQLPSLEDEFAQDPPLQEDLDASLSSAFAAVVDDDDDDEEQDQTTYQPNVLIQNLRNAIVSAGESPEIVDDVLNDIMTDCREARLSTEVKTSTWPSYGSIEDDLLFEEFVAKIPDHIDRSLIVKPSGVFSAPAMITLHFAPKQKNDSNELMCTVNQRNTSLEVFYRKLGVSREEAAALICWTEGFYLKTELSAREGNQKQPHKHVYDEDVLSANDWYVKESIGSSGYRIRIIVHSTQVLADIKEAKNDPEATLFSLPLESGEVVPLYGQKYHGCFHAQKRDIRLYEYHPEFPTYGTITKLQAQFADQMLNTFCAVAGIGTVQPGYFMKFPRANAMSTAFWEKASKRLDALGMVLGMLGIEKGQNHRFPKEALPERLLIYAAKEGLDLSDADQNQSAITQIHRHMARKGLMSQAANGYQHLEEAGVKGRATSAAKEGLDLSDADQNQSAIAQIYRHMGRKGLMSQAANGYQHLEEAGVKGRATSAANGYQHLEEAGVKGRATQAANRQKAVNDEAARKRKIIENGGEPEPEQSPPPRKKTKVHVRSGNFQCTKCKRTFLTQERADSHYNRMHTNADRPFKCGGNCGRCAAGFWSQKELDKHRKRMNLD